MPPTLPSQANSTLDCLASRGVTLWELLGLLGPLGPQQLKALSVSPSFYHMPAGEAPKEPPTEALLGALLEVRRAQHGRGMPAESAIAHTRVRKHACIVLTHSCSYHSRWDPTMVRLEGWLEQWQQQHKCPLPCPGSAGGIRGHE